MLKLSNTALKVLLVMTLWRLIQFQPLNFLNGTEVFGWLDKKTQFWSCLMGGHLDTFLSPTVALFEHIS